MYVVATEAASIHRELHSDKAAPKTWEDRPKVDSLDTAEFFDPSLF